MVAFCRKHNTIAKSENHAEIWSLVWNQDTIWVLPLLLLTYYSLLVVHLLMHVILWFHHAQFAKKYVMINTKLDRLLEAKLLSCQVCWVLGSTNWCKKYYCDQIYCSLMVHSAKSTEALVRQKIFYRKQFAYNSVAICLINTQFSHHIILGPSHN